jgi:site-specific recombinase XerD
MAEAYFFLRKGTKESSKDIAQKQPIYVGCRLGTEQLVYPTGFKVLPKNWDFDKSKIKNVIAVENRDDINSFLLNLKHFIDNTIDRYKLMRKPLTKQDLKTEINNYINPPKIVTVSFFQFIQNFIDDCKSGKRLNDGMRIAERTIKNYTTGYNGLKEYQDYTSQQISFESLNRTFWQEYVHYLTMTKKYKVNTIGSYQKYLIVFLREAKKAKLWIDEDNLLDDAKIMTENPIDVYLNYDEISLIEQLDLSTNTRLEKVRDLFLIGLNTGFRISDWNQVIPENIKISGKDNAYIDIVQTKTRTIATTPLRPIVQEILTKYDNQLPVISEQKFNDYVKELCKLAGITNKIKTTSTIEGGQQIDFFEKWEMVSSHTGRRSFATNMFRDGVESRIIMKATGHSTEKNFKKYLKLDNSEYMDMLAEYETDK